MHRLRKIVTTAITVTAILLMSQAVAESSALEIFVQNRAQANSSFIRLGDIAKFIPATDPRVGNLARVRIAPSPPPGASITINHDFLIYRLGGILANDGDVKVKVPDSLRVTRAAQTVKKDQLIKILHDYVKKHSPWPAGSIRIQRPVCASKVVLPKGKLRWSVRQQGKTHWVGPLMLIVTFWVNERPVTKVPVRATLLVKQRFLKTRTKLVRGHVLRTDDVIVVEKLIGSFNEMYLHSPKEAVGRQLLRSVPQGQLLTKSMIREAPWVRKGQQVRILAENDHIKVITTGKALEDGREGEQVRVVNINSGRQVFATVKGPGMVVVQF